MIDTNPTTPAAVEWSDAEREAVRVLYETWARLVAERERQAAARALREAAEAFVANAQDIIGTPLRRGDIALRLRHRAERIEREGQP